MPTLAHKKNPDFCHRGASKVFIPCIFRNVTPKLKGWRRTIDIDLRTQKTVHSWRMRQTPHLKKVKNMFKGVSKPKQRSL